MYFDVDDKINSRATIITEHNWYPLLLFSFSVNKLYIDEFVDILMYFCLFFSEIRLDKFPCHRGSVS